MAAFIGGLSAPLSKSPRKKDKTTSEKSEANTDVGDIGDTSRRAAHVVFLAIRQMTCHCGCVAGVTTTDCELPRQRDWSLNAAGRLIAGAAARWLGQSPPALAIRPTARRAGNADAPPKSRSAAGQFRPN